MSLNPKPIVFSNGDGGSGRVAKLVRELLFGDFPTIDIPLSVGDRLETDDRCITEAVNAFKKYRVGFKNSTASDDHMIKEKGWSSANIVMRPLVGAYAMLRLTKGPGAYPAMCGTLRYAHGGYYDEQSCCVEVIAGRNTAVITQHMDLNDLKPFAELAIKVAKEHKLHIMLSSKSTISKSEKLFRTEIEKVFKENGLVCGKNGDYHHKLTDIAIAELPVATAYRSDCAKGGFLHVADNPNGDTSSDVIDYQHGNRVMSSTVYCLDEGGNIFTYEELAAGTAPELAEGPLCGETFFNPIAIIFAMASAFEQANPSKSDFFTAVRRLALDYIAQIPDADLDTEEMLDYIVKNVGTFV